MARPLSILAVLLCVVCGACGSDSRREPGAAGVAQFDWLIGDWRGAHEGTGQFFESWHREGDGLAGAGYQIVDGDTTFGEALRIEARDGDLYYVATVTHNKGDVAFKLVDGGAGHAIFENPDHDFPQRIAYELRDDGTLYVRASLIDEAAGRVLQFYFSKNE